MTKSDKIKQTIALFLVTFLVSLIVITYFIKSMSPDVDVEIGGGEEQTLEHEDTDSEVKQPIDDRLRWIQMEDNMPGASKREDGQNNDIEYQSNDDTDNSQDEKVKESESTESSSQEQNTLEPIEYANPDSGLKNSSNTATPPIPLQTTRSQTGEEPFKMSKVFVGSYPTIEQAIQAQNKLMNTNISVSPFVKEVDGNYVLQAGSYANAHKAEAVANEISAAGFPARVVKE